MLKMFPIQFIQQILEQTLLEEHIKNPNYFGGKDQIALHSFYEQLKSDKEVQRFVETYRDLNDQQNRSGLIGNGVLLSPENPTITNLYSSLIVPMSWTCSIRCTLENRDQMLQTLYNLVYKLKGRKQDVAQLKCRDENGKVYYTPFKVGTIGQNDGKPKINIGDFILYQVNPSTPISEQIAGKLENELEENYDLHFDFQQDRTNYMYVATLDDAKHIIKACVYDEDAQQDFPIEDVSLEDYHADEMEQGVRTINGYVTFVSIDPVSSVPTLSNFLMDFWFHDVRTDTDKMFRREITIDPDECSIQDGYLHGIGRFAFDISEEEVDFDGGSTLIGWEQYDDPKVNEPQWQVIENDEELYKDVVFPPEHEDMERFKVSMSFDSFRCDEPNTLNGQEYCEISFGGQATIVSNGVRLGNDMVKLRVSKNKIVGSPNINYSSNEHWLEPLEMPSGLNASTQISQLLSNNFKQNTHTDGIAGILQYTFIYDQDQELLDQWFRYARYGQIATTQNFIAPNLIYVVSELYSSWGYVFGFGVKAKIVETINIENTESDVLTLGVTFQIQGDNN